MQTFSLCGNANLVCALPLSGVSSVHFLQVGPGRGVLGVGLPCPEGCWQCGRTLCSWETFCLAICAVETWLQEFLLRPLYLGKAASHVPVSISDAGSLGGLVVCGGSGGCSESPSRHLAVGAAKFQF